MSPFNQLLSAIAITTALVSPAGGTPLTRTQLEKCASIHQQEIIRAATESIIYIGSRDRRNGVPDAHNPWPYNNFEELINLHPNCCSISTKFIGDYDPRIKDHFDGGSLFKAYFVRIQLPSVAEVGGRFIKGQYDRVVIVTCFGQAVNEEQLIHMDE
jgi:hypothetical protein